MATEKQKLAVDKMVENGGIASKAMIDAKYSKNTAKTPSKLTESKGFKELCEERGLTDSLIVDALVEDIKLKPQNRKAELELGAKMKGLLVEKADVNVRGSIGVIMLPNKYGLDSSKETDTSIDS